MISSWRLKPNEIAIIAHALKQIENQELPKTLYNSEVNQTDLQSLANRFNESASHSPVKK